MRVRVAVILLSLMALIAAPTYAQVGGGAKVGVNWGTISEEEDEGSEDTIGWQPGFLVGGFVDLPISGAFSFSPEILYTRKGAKSEFTDAGFEIKEKLKLDFVQIPLLFKAGSTGTETRPFVVFGPAFGFLTRARFQETFDGEEFDEEDVKDEFKSAEVSVIVGGGVQFGRGIVEVRYDHGINNLLEDEEDEGDELKTRTFSVLFGVRF